MTKVRFLMFIFAALALTTAALHAQEDCPAFVHSTIQTVDQLCSTLGRDEACYGNENMEATGRSSDLSFNTPGDIANVADIESLRLASMQLEDHVWGVVMMQLQANITPDQTQSTVQHVTMVLFGDVSVTNQVPPEVTLSASVVHDTTIYIRPNTTDAPVGTLTTAASVTVNGRLQDNSWMRIVLADGTYGWVTADALQITGDASTLIAADTQGETFGPMQAFVMQTGNSERPCVQAPEDGVLIQTPDGVGEINFLINEVDVRLGSTGFFHTHEQHLNIALLEGHSEITSGGETIILEGGQSSDIPLDENGLADGAPSEPEEYTDPALDALPVEWLPEDVEVTPESIDATDEAGISDVVETPIATEEIVPAETLSVDEQSRSMSTDEPSDSNDVPTDAPPEEPTP